MRVLLSILRWYNTKHELLIYFRKLGFWLYTCCKNYVCIGYLRHSYEYSRCS